MGATLEKRLEGFRQERSEIFKKIAERDKKKSIACESCNESHQIQDLTLIQTYWYVPPHGCTEGAYWKRGEIQFICPETEVTNRMLFDNYDVPWPESKEYANSPEAQFKRNYRSLFKEIIDRYEGDSGGPIRYMDGDGKQLENDEVTKGLSVNNYYVNQNRKKFGLVEKRSELLLV